MPSASLYHTCTLHKCVSQIFIMSLWSIGHETKPSFMYKLEWCKGDERYTFSYLPSHFLLITADLSVLSVKSLFILHLRIIPRLAMGMFKSKFAQWIKAYLHHFEKSLMSCTLNYVKIKRSLSYQVAQQKTWWD